MEVMRWVLVGIIGLCTGIVAAFIDICVKELFKAKFSVFEMGNLLSVHAAYSSLYMLLYYCHVTSCSVLGHH